MAEDSTDLVPTGTKTGFPARNATRAVLGACLKAVDALGHLAETPQGEQVEPHQAETLSESARLTREHQRARWTQCPPFRRGFHAKSNGVVQATFRVHDDIDEDLRVGVFATPGREFQSWLRFSNGAQQVQPDRVQDTRGLAIKLMGVEGAKLGLPVDGDEREAGTQDFIMMAGFPSFFVASAAEYVEFQKAVSSGAYYLDMKTPGRAHRLRELLIAFQVAGISPRTPLDTRYYSLAPYALGDGAMKYSVWQTAGPPAPAFDPDDPDFLRKGLARQLAQGDVTLTFAIQKRVEGCNMPLEDWTVLWRESDSPYRPVATITIPQQDFDTPERRAYGDSLSYNPWHALPEHRPLGQLGLLRGVVYQNSRQLRHFENKAAWGEPEAWGCPLPHAAPQTPDLEPADG